MKFLRYIAKSFSLTFFTLMLLSCYSNTSNQNTAVQENVFFSEQIEAIEPAIIAGITLIPSVEPEQLRNVMPNSWQKLSRLTEAEEQAFIRENTAILLRLADFFRNYRMGWNWGNTKKLEYYCIYRQQVGTDTFYRVFFTFDSNPDFLSPAIRFYQSLFITGLRIPRAGPYNTLNVLQGGYNGSFFSLDIITDKGKAIGIMETELCIRRIDNPNNWSDDAGRRNGQLYGGIACNYYFMDDLLNGNRSPIVINATDCLVDPDIPLRYSLQNAFDGDPATSYVENTEDNFAKFDLSFFYNYKRIHKIAIINGYAQNRDLYNWNNKVKEISVDTHQLNSTKTELEIIFLGKWLLEDNTLDYQFINVEKPDSFQITDIFHGTMYNDTCIAELNFLTDNGWLFGDIHE